MARLRAELIQRPLLGGDFMDQPLLGQLVQLAIHCGEAHGEAALAQVLGKVGGGETFLRPLL